MVVLQKIRELNENPTTSWQEMIAPQHFKLIVKAVALVSGATGDFFSHPSNALKAGYYIKEMASIKESTAIMARDQAEAEDARLLLLVCKKNWCTQISAVACATLNERSFNRAVDLPRPADLNRLSEYLHHEASTIQKIDS